MELPSQWPNPVAVVADGVIVGDADRRWLIDPKTGAIVEHAARGAEAQALVDGWSVTPRFAVDPEGKRYDGPILGITRAAGSWWIATRDTLQRVGGKTEKREGIRGLGAMLDGVAWVDAEGLHAGECTLPLGKGTPWIAASERWVLVSGGPGMLVVDRRRCAVVAAREGKTGRATIQGDEAWEWDGTSLTRWALPTLAQLDHHAIFAATYTYGDAKVRGRTVLRPKPWGLPEGWVWAEDRFVGSAGGRLTTWDVDGNVTFTGGEIGPILAADRHGDGVVATDGRVVRTGDTAWEVEDVVVDVHGGPGGPWFLVAAPGGTAWQDPTGAPVPSPRRLARSISNSPMRVGGALLGLDGPFEERWRIPESRGSLRCASIPAAVGADRFDWTFERPTLLTAREVSLEALPPGLDVLTTQAVAARDASTLAIGHADPAAIERACGALPGDEAWIVGTLGEVRRYGSADAAALAHEAEAESWAPELFPAAVVSVVTGTALKGLFPLDGGAVIAATDGGSARIDAVGVRWHVRGEVRRDGEQLQLDLGVGAALFDLETGAVGAPVRRTAAASRTAWGWDCGAGCVGAGPNPIGDAEWLLVDGDLVIRKGRRTFLHLSGVESAIVAPDNHLLVRVGRRAAPWRVIDARGELVAVLPSGRAAVSGELVWIGDERAVRAFSGW